MVGVAAIAMAGFGAGGVNASVPPQDPPALGKAVAVNNALPRAVILGVTQTGVATTADATAGRIGFFTTTPTETGLNFTIVSQSSAVPAAGFSTSTAVYMLTPGGGTYRAAAVADGTFGVSQSVDGVWNVVGTATLAIDGQVTEIDVQSGAWTAPGTTIVVIRRDLDASMAGFETATPPILLDALASVGFGGSIPLLATGTLLSAEGLTNTPCAIANMPTVTLDPATSSVTFTFAAPPAEGLQGTIAGVSLVDLINPPNISGRFGDAVWTGTRDGQPIGEFAVTTSGNSITVATANESGSVFANNHEALTIGISDPSGCYSLSPAVPFALVLGAKGEAVDVTTTVAAATTATTVVASVSTTTLPGSTITALPADGSTTTVALAPATETFTNDDSSTPWTAIIVVGILAVAVGIGGGILLSRRDRMRAEARDALFTPRPRTRSAEQPEVGANEVATDGHDEIEDVDEIDDVDDGDDDGVVDDGGPGDPDSSDGGSESD